jgi:NADH dehydrogenase FAD-containing subunit
MQSPGRWWWRRRLFGGGQTDVQIRRQQGHRFRTLSGEFHPNLLPDLTHTLVSFQTHYYQPMFTMIGGGIKSLAQSGRPMKSVLPANAKWIQDAAAKFEPESNLVMTKNGDTIEYDFLLVAMGLQLRFEKVALVLEAFGHW